jgi:putative acetyltransferase
MTAVALPAIRPETPSDTGAIRTVLCGAFAREAEADLVERLRTAGDLVLALIAEATDGRLLGYVAFVRLALHEGGWSDYAAGLAPLAVAPDHQRRGVGSALVREGLAVLKKRGERLVFVLGDPAYYARFGFRAETAASFHAPYGGPHFMALRLTDGKPETGNIRYPAAFDRLG